MMKNPSFPLSETYRMLESGPVVLVTTACDGRPNIMPMSWNLDALRTTMRTASPGTFGLRLGYMFLLLTTTVLVLICARLYPRLAV